MDIFATILSLAGVDPPSDRRYDGIDVTDILLHGSETGHKAGLLLETVFIKLFLVYKIRLCIQNKTMTFYCCCFTLSESRASKQWGSWAVWRPTDYQTGTLQSFLHYRSGVIHD